MARHGPRHRHHPDLRSLAMRDIVDSQLESLDRRRIGRVADLEIDWAEDGSLRLVSILVGPEAQAGAVWGRLRHGLHRLLKGRFEHAIPMTEVEELGPTIRLTQRAEAYHLDGADRWLDRHVLRFIPGNGREPDDD